MFQPLLDAFIESASIKKKLSLNLTPPTTPRPHLTPHAPSQDMMVRVHCIVCLHKTQPKLLPKSLPNTKRNHLSHHLTST